MSDGGAVGDDRVIASQSSAASPTALAAVPAAWRLVRLRRGELFVSVALIAVMLAPVLVVVDGRRAAFTSLLVPLALVPLSLVTPARSTTRTALTYLLGAIVVSAGMSVAVPRALGLLVAVSYIPLTALLPAYWIMGS